jgi:hypothetical protein
MIGISVSIFCTIITRPYGYLEQEESYSTLAIHKRLSTNAQMLQSFVVTCHHVNPSILRYRLVFTINCLPDLAACTTHIIKLLDIESAFAQTIRKNCPYHASFGGSLLRLKEDSFLLLAGGTLSLNSRQLQQEILVSQPIQVYP